MLKKNKDKELDYNNLNSIIKTGNRLVKLFFYMTINEMEGYFDYYYGYITWYLSN